MGQKQDETGQAQRVGDDWTDEPTNEYAMRHAANGMIEFANRNRDLPREDLELIDYAYKQLLRGANMIRGEK